MNEIRQLLKTARIRMETTTFLRAAHMVAIVAASIALALMIADRTPAAAFVPWLWIGPALAAVAIVIALIVWSRRRRTDLQVAMAVDERLELREKLSTALHCEKRDDPFARAAMEDAVTAARDGRNHELVRRHFAVTPPPGWWISPLILLLVVMVSFLNPLNLFAGDAASDQEIVEARTQSETAIEAVIKEIKSQPELSNELSDLLGELTREGIDPDNAKRPEDIKRDAIKKVTDLNKKLDELVNGEKGKAAEALKDKLNQLNTPDEGPAKELSEALANGDFSAAKQAMEELKKKIESGEMDEAAKAEAAEQMQNIADQLDKLAQQQKQLEDALKQAGMDPQLAKNPQALQQAIQNNQNLNQQQQQQLQQMAQAQQMANQMCQGLGQACQNMAQAMGNQGQGQGAQGAMGQMAQQLNNLEAMSQMLQQAQAAMSQCQGQCNGIGQGMGLGQAMKQGGAFGGPGQGKGGKAPLAPTPWAAKAQKADVKTNGEGDIIARILFQGQQVRGESKAQLEQVAEIAREGYDEAVLEDQLPRRYHEAQKHYFGELEKLTEAVEREQKDAASGTGDSGAGDSGAADGSGASDE